MSSTVKFKNANKLINKDSGKLSFFANKNYLVLLFLLYKRGPKTLDEIITILNLNKSTTKKMLTEMVENKIISLSKDIYTLSNIVKTNFDYTSSSPILNKNTIVSGKFDNIKNPLGSNYKIIKQIGKGASSYTYLAKQIATHKEITLKVFLPNAVSFSAMDSALKKRAKIKRNLATPEIFDAGEAQIEFSDGSNKVVPCVALKYIDSNAKTFEEFLISQQNINKMILERFIERIGGTLAEIENANLCHGDLHERNILVVPGTSPSIAMEFWLIDFIGTPSFVSDNFEIPSDLECFRNHLLRASVLICEKYPGYSARLLFGEKAYRVLEALRNNSLNNFNDMMKLFYKEADTVPTDHFNSPSIQPFEWLRVEWITDPIWLFKLFEPVPATYKTISRFGNTWISGPRGCGKSHYLRVLAFHPSVIQKAINDKELSNKLIELDYSFKDKFGILFACRLGEFKGFVPEAIGDKKFSTETQLFLKHILILKIINKTLTTIRDGLEVHNDSSINPILKLPTNIEILKNFLESKLGLMATINDGNVMSTFLQILSTIIARENSAISLWNKPDKQEHETLLNENDLDVFFTQLKNTFQDLKDSKFYILVDDASYGNIHEEMQKVLNSLVRSAHANHCFKLTYDKYMYTLESADNRSLDPRQEGTYVDLGEVSTKVQRSTSVDLSSYLAKVIDTRLRAANYQFDIKSLLGKSPSVKDFLSALSHQRKAKSKSHAYYAGWNIIWSITHGSVRTLLELIEYIFKTNNVTPNTSFIPLKNQDASVRSYSRRQFRALTMLPGEIDGEPLGQRLQAIISGVGEMSKEYLKKYDTGEEGRWYETISIERLDRKKLDSKSQETLLKLVEYGLLLDEGVTFSRAQFGLSQRYDLNKIYSPVFEITYRVRNHLYLGKEQMELLLSKPAHFVKYHKNKLSDLVIKKRYQKGLFD